MRRLVFFDIHINEFIEFEKLTEDGVKRVAGSINEVYIPPHYPPDGRPGYERVASAPLLPIPQSAARAS